MNTFYVNTGSWFESLHPISKLYFVAAMAVVPFLTANLGVLGAYLAVVVLLAYSAQVGGRFVGVLLRAVAPLLLLLFAMQSLLYPGGQDILFQWGGLAVKREGVLFAAVVGMRLLVVVGAILLMLMSTHPKHLVVALEQRGMPAKAGYIILSTMQIIPQMQTLSRKILDAQKSRGVEVEGGLWTRIRAYIPVVGPLILASIAQLENKALALESRAFNAAVKKTSMIDFTMTAADRALRAGSILILVGAVAGRVVPLWL
jgi:ABC-type cobalt transport system, permease component CbiQ and related transporters